MNTEKLNEIKERAEKATSGPWRMAFGANYELAVRELDGDKFIADIDYESTSDAAFIAHAREDVPSLVVEVERLRNALESAGGMFSIGEGGKAMDYICKGLAVDWSYFDEDDAND